MIYPHLYLERIIKKEITSFVVSTLRCMKNERYEYDYDIELSDIQSDAIAQAFTDFVFEIADKEIE